MDTVHEYLKNFIQTIEAKEYQQYEDSTKSNCTIPKEQILGKCVAFFEYLKLKNEHLKFLDSIFKTKNKCFIENLMKCEHFPYEHHCVSEMVSTSFGQSQFHEMIKFMTCHSYMVSTIHKSLLHHTKEGFSKNFKKL